MIKLEDRESRIRHGERGRGRGRKRERGRCVVNLNQHLMSYAILYQFLNKVALYKTQERNFVLIFLVLKFKPYLAPSP